MVPNHLPGIHLDLSENKGFAFNYIYISILLEQIDDYPLVNVYMPMETIIFNGKTHYFYGHGQ